MLGRVSVVVPLYNHAHFVERAIESVIAQGPILRELIVIDDGSTDESAAVMLRLEGDDPRIRFEKQANHGAHATINRGLREAEGEYVAILNSDDTYELGRLEALAHALDLDQGSAIASSSIAFMDDAGQPIPNPWFEAALANYKRVRDLGLSLVEANFVMTTSNMLIRRSLLAAIGDFAPLRYTHDLEFLLRAVATGHRLAFVDRRLLRYRFHARNTISEDHRAVRMEWALCAAIYMRLAGQHARGWSAESARAVEEVLDRHGLTRAVALCTPRLPSTGATDTAARDILNDAAFRIKLIGTL